MELVGVAEVAARLGVKPGTIRQWQRRHADFPQPLARLAAGPVWNWEDFGAWVAKPRPPGRPRKDSELT